jgi:zinc transporter ZupT
MEFLLLGGMILVMSLFTKVPAMKDANKALTGLQIPVGIVVLVVGLSGLLGTGNMNAFAALMGVIAGITLVISLFKLIPKAQESVDRVSTTLATFQVPIGVITIIAALTAMF